MSRQALICLLALLLVVAVLWITLTPASSSEETKEEEHPLDNAMVALPEANIIDVNVGTWIDPMQRRPGRGLVLVEPLFRTCEQLAISTTLASDPEILLLCMALSNYTGFATFQEIFKGGVSSSLAPVMPGSSHGNYKTISRRTVQVMDGISFFQMLRQGRPLLEVECIKLDMQGLELTLIRNLAPLLTDPHFVFYHFRIECSCPGRPIYQMDNDCTEIDSIFVLAGYTVSQDYVTYCASRPKNEWTDLRAWKDIEIDCTWEGTPVS